MQDTDARGGSIEAVLKRIAEEDRTNGASAKVEERLLAEVRTIARVRRRRIGSALAVAAGLLLAAGVPVWRSMTRRHVDVTAVTPARPDAVGREVDEGVTVFFPLGNSALPSTGTRIVRIEVPRAALRPFGVMPIEQPGGAPSSTSVADVLIGEDGLARAVRFVRAAKIQE